MEHGLLICIFLAIRKYLKLHQTTSVVKAIQSRIANYYTLIRCLCLATHMSYFTDLCHFGDRIGGD